MCFLPSYLSLLIPILVCLLCSGFHFGKSVFKKWFRWDVWAFTTRWRHMGVGVRCFVLLMWLFCIWSAGYAVLPIIQWFDPLHPGSPHDTSRLLYSSSVSKCHNQLPYSHSGLWGLLLYVSENSFLFKCNCLPFRPSIFSQCGVLLYSADSEILLSHSCIQSFFMWGKCGGWLAFAMLRAQLWG